MPEADTSEIAADDVTVTSPFAVEESDPNSPMVQWLIAGTDHPASLAESFGSGNGRVSEDGTVVFAEVSVPGDTDVKAATLWGTEVKDGAPEIAGVQVEIGGSIFAKFAPPNSEALGLGFAIVILIIAFGSVLAMGLPIGTALSASASASVSPCCCPTCRMPDFTRHRGDDRPRRRHRLRALHRHPYRRSCHGPTTRRGHRRSPSTPPDGR